MLFFLPPKFKADLKARNLTKKPRFSAFRKPAIHFTYMLRMAEHLLQSSNPVLRLLGHYYRIMARRYGLRFGITLPLSVHPGPGLYIMHAGSIVVNGGAKIGDNCRIHAGVNIGETGTGVPRIGNNVYLGPGAKIFGGIDIGDNARIGANAVVSRSVPPGATAKAPYAQVVERSTPVDAETTHPAQSMAEAP